MQLATFLTRFEALALAHYAVKSFRRGIDPGDAKLGNAPLPVVFLESDLYTSEVTPAVDSWQMAFQVLTRPTRDGASLDELAQQMRDIATDLIEVLRKDGTLKNGTPTGVSIFGLGADAGMTGWRMEITLHLEKKSREGLAERFDPAYVPPGSGSLIPPLPALTAGHGLERVGNQVVAKLGEGLALDEQGRIASNGTGSGGGVSEGFVSAAVADEAAARTSADSLLSSLLTAEVAARSAADTTHTTAIASEATTRAAADVATDAALAAEVNARVAAIAALTTTVSNIVGMAPATLDTLQEIAARILDDEASMAALSALIATKVDKVTGYGLSKNDFTDTLLAKLNAIAAGATANSTDVFLRDRANHTGVQDMATVTGLTAALAAFTTAIAGKLDTSAVFLRNLSSGFAEVAMGPNTTERLLYTIELDSALAVAGKDVEIWVRWWAGSANAKTPRLRVGNSAVHTGNAIVKTFTLGVGNVEFERRFVLRWKDATTLECEPVAKAADGVSTTAGQVITTNVATSSKIYLHFTGQQTATTDGLILKGLTVTVRG